MLELKFKYFFLILALFFVAFFVLNFLMLFYDNHLLFSSLSFCLLLFCLFFVFYFFYKFSSFFKNIVSFLKNIDKKNTNELQNTVFAELNELNSALYGAKYEFAKKQKENKKQYKKINIKNMQFLNIISAISHELKNPLSVINLSLDILENEKIKNKALLDKIRKQCQKINMLSSKLNLVFNLKSKEIQRLEFDLYELCKNIIQEHNFNRVILQGQSSYVDADVFLIEQVIINLLNNALKYSKKEVILTVKDKELIVKDFGIGIAKEHIKLVSKKFYKIDSSSENSFGIGLFLVKKILLLHGSHLQISSKLGEFSEFSFRL